MACEGTRKRKCFTFIWKLENAVYCWQRSSECIESPLFAVDEILQTKWKLELYPSIERNDNIGFWLQRQAQNELEVNAEIDCELSFLSSEGTVLHSWEGKKLAIEQNGYFGRHVFASRNEVFFERKSVFLPQNTLTACCRMWKSVGEFSKNEQWFARTRIGVEKRSFLWDIDKFSCFPLASKRTHEIKSLCNNKALMTLELRLTGGMVCEKKIHLKTIPVYENIKISTFQLSIVNASKNAIICFHDEFWIHDSYKSKDFTLFPAKKELMENKNVYLPNDVLSLLCECVFSFGIVLEEIEEASSVCEIFEDKELFDYHLEKKHHSQVSKEILTDNLKSMLNDSCVSDVNLKTKNQTYPSHKFILSARSPVFKAMFSNDMKEKINECVDIEDLTDDTLLRMLHYIYSAEVEELEWVNAIELFVAADKYQILNLKDICASYLKRNMCVNNACEALVIADRHQEKDLKDYVQDYILSHGKDIINSEKWEQLMEANLKLAAETMRLKYKE